MLQQRHPDFVIVAIGANDGQGFVEGGVTYQFGTPGWQDIYQQRVKAYIDMLAASGATVIWLELPPMKSSVYDTRIALVNRIALTVVKSEPHAIWFSTAGIIGDVNGRFRDFGNVDGRPSSYAREMASTSPTKAANCWPRSCCLGWLATPAAPAPAPAPAPAASNTAAAKAEGTP